MDNENSDHPPQCPWQSGSFSCSIVPLYGRSRDPDMISYERDALNCVRRIPQRPPPPTCQEISPVSFGGLQQTPEVHHTHGSSYASSSLLRLGSINFLHPIIEIFAEMVSSRMSGPSVTNRYAYDHSSSFSTATAHTPRARRQLMRADQSLIRLCLFFCCMILCLLMFWIIRSSLLQDQTLASNSQICICDNLFVMAPEKCWNPHFL